MSEFHPRRGRNWYSAMGLMFIIVAGIVIVRDTIIWSPDFVVDFLFNSDVTSEKVSFGMFMFGGFLLFMGFRKKIV